MTWKEWRALFKFEKTINIPALDIVIMCPYLFVRIMWYATSRQLKAWPNTLDSGIVLGWRLPFKKAFKEHVWLHKTELPLALYGACDEAYAVRSAKELRWDADKALETAQWIHKTGATYIVAAVRDINALAPKCEHNYWIANCENCARRAFNRVVMLTAKYLPKSVPDPHEDPLTAFRRREKEAKLRLGVAE